MTCYMIISKLSDMKLSKKLQRKASRLMPKGVTDSIFVNNARGSHIWDVDGNEYIDYKLGWSFTDFLSLDCKLLVINNTIETCCC